MNQPSHHPSIPSTERWRQWHEKDKDALRLYLKAQIEKRRQEQHVVAHPLWTPLPGPQTLAYESEADELYYGGGGGGGKTDLALGLALTRHRRSLFLRREATQLRDVIDRSHTVLDGAGAWNGTAHVWRNIPGNRVLEFGGCENEHAMNKFKGRAHDLKCFDEGADLSERQYLFISAWNRTTVEGQRCRILLCSNPPTSTEGEWVMRRWAPWLITKEALPGELRWYTTLDGKDTQVESGAPFVHKGETIYPRSRTFIPASVTDNPYLMRTGYQQVLQGLPEPYRSQLLYGDFEAGREDDAWQVIPTAWVKAAQARWTATPPVPLSTVGVDVARGGKDKTVIAMRYGNWFAPLHKRDGKDTPDGPSGAAFVQHVLGGQNPQAIGVDIIGVGGAVYDALRPPYGSRLHAFNAAEASDAMDKSGTLKLLNVRAASLWKLRESLDPASEEHLMLPPDDELRADLCASRWQPTTRGIKIEDKEEVRKRIGRSPDCGDALAIAHFLVFSPLTYISVAPRRFAGSKGAY